MTGLLAAGGAASGWTPTLCCGSPLQGTCALAGGALLFTKTLERVRQAGPRADAWRMSLAQYACSALNQQSLAGTLAVPDLMCAGRKLHSNPDADELLHVADGLWRSVSLRLTSARSRCNSRMGPGCLAELACWMTVYAALPAPGCIAAPFASTC